LHIRERARAVVDNRRFQQVIIGVIVLNAITLGLETSTSLMASIGDLLHVIDRATLSIFVLEIIVRLYAYGWRFFRDSWNVFDFLIVGISLVPASGALSVLRTMRVLRVLRLISAFPAMRRVVSGLLTAVPGMASIAALLALIIFVAGVMATKLFGAIAPEFFGDLGTTLFTLFQIMTGEAWPDIARTVMAQAPLAWIFFVVYILVSSFAVLNLFIAVIVSSMEQGATNELVETEERNAEAQAASDATILEEVRALRVELADLRAATVLQPAAVRQHGAGADLPERRTTRRSSSDPWVRTTALDDATTVLSRQGRWAAMSVYTSAHDGEHLKAALDALLREFGIEVAAEDPPVLGSWFQRFWVRLRDSDAADGLQKRLSKVEQAVELHHIGKAQAEIDRNKSEAVAVLLGAVRDEKEAVIRLGSLVIVKWSGSVTVWTISETQAAELDSQGDLIGKPAQVLSYLRDLGPRPLPEHE